MGEKIYTGNKPSRFRAMMSIGLLTATMALSTGVMAKDANAAGAIHMTDNSINQEHKIQHRNYINENFVEKEIDVEDGNHSERLKALGIKPKTKKIKVLVPTKEHQKEINRSIEKYNDMLHEMNRNEARQNRQTRNGFADSLSVHNPNSEYYTPDYNSNVHKNVNIENSNIHGNVKIGTIENNDRGRW